jgi:hypothetical protein
MTLDFELTEWGELDLKAPMVAVVQATSQILEWGLLLGQEKPPSAEEIIPKSCTLAKGRAPLGGKLKEEADIRPGARGGCETTSDRLSIPGPLESPLSMAAASLPMPAGQGQQNGI